MGFFKYILQDWDRNKKNTKGKLITFLFRIGGFLYARKFLKIILYPYFIFYRLIIEWILGIELPWHTTVGNGLIIYHGQTMVVNKNSIIGSNCIIRHSTTIGNSKKNSKCPVIGNNVDIGAHVCILGNIKIGDNVVIGAGSVVLKDVPNNTLVAGNPAKVIKYL
jgi:serine acetyltransferase